MDAPLIAPGKPASLNSSQAASRLGAPAAATLLIVAYATITSLLLPVNVDVSWLLTVGDRVLNGERLYVDIAEANPPFSTWLYLPFLVMERLTGLAAELWLSVGLAALAVASIWFSARILIQADESLKRYAWLAPVAVFCVLFLLPLDFGQREQISVIALLPWLALFSVRDHRVDFHAGSAAERIVAGAGAAVFVMIKPPYSVLALAVPALVVALQRRSLRPLWTTENVVGGFLTVIYLTAVAVFMRPFFTDVLPLLRQVYLPMRAPVVDMLTLWPIEAFLAMAATTLAMARPDRIHRDAKILLLAGTAYVPAFLMMGKGWTYQALPFLTFGALAFLLQFVRRPPWRDLTILARTGTALGLLLLILIALQGQVSALLQPRGDLDAATAAIAIAVDRPTVMSIGSRLQVGNPLVRAVGGRLVGRHPSAWMVRDSGLLIEAGRDPVTRKELQALRDTYILDIAKEVTTKRPDIVLDDGTAVPSAPVLLKIADNPPPPRPLRDNPAVADALRGYRLLLQNGSVTVLIRADTAAR